MATYSCFDAMASEADLQPVEADDCEQAAHDFARLLQQSGEEYESYKVGVVGPEGERWIVRIGAQPEIVSCAVAIRLHVVSVERGLSWLN